MSNRSKLLSFAGLAALAGLKGFQAGTAPSDPADPPVDPADPPVDPDAPPVDPEDPDAPPVKKPAVPAQPEAALTADTVLASDAVRLAEVARSEGTAAANARWKAVLESKEGKANVTNAIFLLGNSTASADACIAHLATLPPASSIAATTPKLDLTGAKPAAGAGAVETDQNPDAVDTTKLWASVQEAAANPLTAGGNKINLAA